MSLDIKKIKSFILIILLLVLGCSDDNLRNLNSDSVEYSSKTLDNFFSFSNNKYYRNSYIYHDVTDSDLILNQILEDKINFQHSNNIIGFDLILNNINNNEFNSDQIAGIIVYSIKNDNLKLFFYKKEFDNYLSIDEAFKVNSYNLNTINLITRNFISEDNNDVFIKSLINFNEFNNYSDQGDATKIFKSYISLSRNSLNENNDEPVIIDPSGFCSLFFPDCDSVGDCEQSGAFEYACVGGFCPKESLKESSTLSGLDNDMVMNNLVLNNSLHYDLRDNYFSGSNLGEKYIDYYYGISEYLETSDYFDLALLNKIHSTMPSIDSKISIMTNSGNANSILLDQNLASQIKDILDIINDDNKYLNYVIQDLKKDLDYFVGKDKNAVLSIL